MRLLLAMFKHETNTFSPVETPLQRFYRMNTFDDSTDQLLAQYRGTGSALGGFIDVAERHGAEIVIATAAEAWPSGPATDETYRVIAQAILREVRKGGYDGILLDLHGAMVTQSLDDAEGALLSELRSIDPVTPVGVTLDMHANVFDEIVTHATVVTGYHTYPHVDMFESGVRAADIVVRAIRGEVHPVMAWGNVPVLPHVLNQGTHQGPNKALQESCIAYEEDGSALGASLFVGFPNADVANAGVSVVVCTDGEPSRAREIKDDLLAKAWESRHDFVYESGDLIAAVRHAKAAEQFPVVMLDHCDNAASGGSMDATVVLAEILSQGLKNVVFFAIWDPVAVQQGLQAGIGAQVTLSLGGKTAMPTLTQPSHPITVTGRVKLASAGNFRNRGPMGKGKVASIGPTIVLDTGDVEIVVISEHLEPHDVNCLLSLGIDPEQKHYIALKSRMHWRAGFGQMARLVVECNGLGVTTSDYSLLDFRKLRRPMFPIDAI